MSDAPDTRTGTTAPRRGCGAVAAGILLVLLGIVMLPCPGPGMVVLAAGAGMVAAGLGLSRRDPT